jgi:hypothetical protein
LRRFNETAIPKEEKDFKGISWNDTKTIRDAYQRRPHCARSKSPIRLGMEPTHGALSSVPDVAPALKPG